MQWINNQRGYGWISIALHWLAAIAIIVMLWTGFSADRADESGDRAALRLIIAQHISFGMTFLLLLLARVISSYAQPRPIEPEQAKPLKLLAVATHQLLLLAIVIQIVTGPLMQWASARPIDVWNWFSIPSPFAERNRPLREVLEAIHTNARWPMVALITLHTLGALKHAMIDRDGVLRRMLTPQE